MNARTIWHELEEHLQMISSDYLSSLQKPATQQAIKRLEKTVGRAIPDDFKDYLSVHDGQDEFGDRLICEEGRLLSVAQIIQTWHVLNEINDGATSERIVWWHQRLLPFTFIEDDHACIHLDTGEIVMHIHDGEIQYGVAKDFLSWFEEKLQVIKNRRFHLQDDALDFWCVD